MNDAHQPSASGAAARSGTPCTRLPGLQKHAVAFWDDLALVAMMLMTTLVAFTSAYGVYRYYVIKNVLSKPTKDLPADYGRKSTRPLAVLVVLCSVVTAAGMYSQMWEKN